MRVYALHIFHSCLVGIAEKVSVGELPLSQSFG